MPVNVVMRAPRRYRFRRLRRRARTGVGVALVMIAMLAITAAVIAVIAAPVLFLAERVQPGGSPFSAPWEGLGVGLLLSMLIGLGAMSLGFGQIREASRLVLFLRRFGYDEATRAVTFAASRSMGRSWRLVTLDDAEIAPVGPATPAVIDRSAPVIALARRVRRGFWRVFGLPMRRLRIIVVVAAVIPIVALMTSPQPSLSLLGQVAEDYADVMLEPIRSGHLSVPLGVDLKTAFLAVVALACVGVVGWVLVVIAGLLALVLMGPMLAANRLWGGIESAEKLQRFGIGADVDVERGVQMIDYAGRQLFTPSLAVINVTPAVWRATVVRLAELSTVVLVDVSDPSTYLLWEIDHLSALRDKLVFVGKEDRVRAIASAATSEAAPDIERQLATLLDGQQILAYDPSPTGVAVFGAELADTFESRVR